jgi:hypothetical protein
MRLRRARVIGSDDCEDFKKYLACIESKVLE